jgi:hypothetical protein
LILLGFFRAAEFIDVARDAEATGARLARAVRLARVAIEELTVVALRLKS